MAQPGGKPQIAQTILGALISTMAMRSSLVIDGVRHRAFLSNALKGRRLAMVELNRGRWEFRVRRKGRRAYEELRPGECLRLEQIRALVGEMQNARIEEELEFQRTG